MQDKTDLKMQYVLDSEEAIRDLEEVELELELEQELAKEFKGLNV